jgi:hypothetical protein
MCASNESATNSLGTLSNYQVESGTLLIGYMSELTMLEPYNGGTYTTDNGIVIHLDTFIDHMAVTETMKKNIIRSPREKESSDSVMTERMQMFHGKILNNLRGHIKKNKNERK